MTLREEVDSLKARVIVLENLIRGRLGEVEGVSSERVAQALELLSADTRRGIYESHRPGEYFIDNCSGRSPRLNSLDFKVLFESRRLAEKFPGKNLRYWVLRPAIAAHAEART